MGVQQKKKILPLARTTFRCSYNMVILWEKHINWRKIRED